MTEALAVYTPEVEEHSLTINRPPDAVLAEAKKAAEALAAVIRGKAKPVKFNGEVYLEFEDWQVCARFYGLSVRVTKTSPVTFGDVHGWEATAEVIHNSNGALVSSADSMCLNDEANWRNKPQFMLRSMAQTRACAKALRNVLAWVVVLAGYKPTPAEEMDGVQGFSYGNKEEKKFARVDLDAKSRDTWALAKKHGIAVEQIKNYCETTLGKAKLSELTPDDFDGISLWIEETAASRVVA